MDNLGLYNSLREVPEEAKKPITGGRLKGMTDVNSMWRIKRLTELFGPCGVGWKTENERYWMEAGAEGVIAAFCELDLLYLQNGSWSQPVHGVGGSMFVASEKGGLYTSDEAYKMARTDAIGVAGKMLGLAADVYNANDQTKYKAVRYLCEGCKREILDTMLKSGELWTKQDAIIYSLRRFGKMLCPECQKEAGKQQAKEKEQSSDWPPVTADEGV